MKPDIKTKWLEALRSGEYRQYDGGALHITTPECARFCCLGVLCDLHRKEFNGTWGGAPGDHLDYLRATQFLPETVMVWAGLDYRDPMVCEPDTDVPVQHTLSELNDMGIGFLQLADYIEEQL